MHEFAVGKPRAAHTLLTPRAGIYGTRWARADCAANAGASVWAQVVLRIGCGHLGQHREGRVSGALVHSSKHQKASSTGFL